MKILQIASGDFFSTYGGGQVYVKNIVDEMIRQGLDVSVLSFVDKEIAIEKLDYKGIALWEIGTLINESNIEELVQSISPDIIHAHSQKAFFTTIGERLHIPVVVTAHHGGILCPAGALMNADECICQTTLSHNHCLKCCLANIRTGRSWYPLMKFMPRICYIRLGEALEKLPFIPFVTPIGGVALSIENKIKEWQTIYDKATKVIAPSNAIAEAMCRNGLSRAKLEIIPHGIPKDGTTVTKHNKDGKMRFFYVGRIGRLKGIHILLEAFSRINKSLDVELHVIGETGNTKASRRYMNSLFEKYHISNIVWHGKVLPSKMFDTIKEYDVMIHPTICLEVFGLNIAEALAMNKPVLATRCGGAEMQIVDGVNGWLVEPNNADVLQSKMESIMRQGISMDTKLLNRSVISIEQHVISLLESYRNL